MNRWPQVAAWIDALRAEKPDVGHSPEGAALALQLSLDALSAVPDHLDRLAPPHTVVVCASTVFTAPLEWAAVLLARGGRVTLKAPRALEPWFAQVAALTSLPLASTTDRAVLANADCIVAMGSDATLDAIRTGLSPKQRLLGFGHRISLAWWEDPDAAERLALDLALYDGRGCMSPVGVFSPLPDAVDRLAHAMMRLQDRVPRGVVHPAEGAAIRARAALAKVTGEVRTGAGWAVHGLPRERFQPRALPRVPAVYTSDFEGFLDVLGSAGPISTVGSDRPVTVDGARTCPLGQMQTPPLDRLHDGVDWLREL